MELKLLPLVGINDLKFGCSPAEVTKCFGEPEEIEELNKRNSEFSMSSHEEELLQYYKSYNGKRQLAWKDQLGEDLNWALSFDETLKDYHR